MPTLQPAVIRQNIKVYGTTLPVKLQEINPKYWYGSVDRIDVTFNGRRYRLYVTYAYGADPMEVLTNLGSLLIQHASVLTTVRPVKRTVGAPPKYGVMVIQLLS